MKLLGSTKSKKTRNKNGENVLYLETIEVVLVHCNIVKIYSKSFGQLLDISHKNVIFSKTFNSEFSYIDVWFTD